MCMETKNKISRQEGGTKGKSLTWRCFYLAVTDETTTVRDGGRAFQKRIGTVKPVVVM